MELVKLRPGGPAARRPDGKDEIMNKYVNVPCAKCGKPITGDFTSTPDGKPLCC